jgi:hypothetical protein
MIRSSGESAAKGCGLKSDTGVSAMVTSEQREMIATVCDSANVECARFEVCGEDEAMLFATDHVHIALVWAYGAITSPHFKGAHKSVFIKDHIANRDIWIREETV